MAPNRNHGPDEEHGRGSLEREDLIQWSGEEDAGKSGVIMDKHKMPAVRRAPCCWCCRSCRFVVVVVVAAFRRNSLSTRN